MEEHVHSVHTCSFSAFWRALRPAFLALILSGLRFLRAVSNCVRPMKEASLVTAASVKTRVKHGLIRRRKATKTKSSATVSAKFQPSCNSE